VTRPSPKFPRRAPRALGILCAIFAFTASVDAQVPVVEYDGPEIFCHILKHFKFETIQSIDKLSEYDADETLIVIFGELAPLDAIRKRAPTLDEFALLIASDRASGRYRGAFGFRWESSKLEPWHLLIRGSEVHVAEEHAYHERPRWPLLRPGEISHNHPIFRGITTGVATNGPSFLLSDQSDLHLLARFPSSARTQGGGRLQADHEDAGYIYGSSAESEQRLLFIAGHGVFINGMIAQNDNDNGLFAVNTIRWLRDGPNGKRKYALVIHDGKVIESFGLPLTGLPPVPIPPVRVINRMLHELEKEKIVNRFLAEFVGWPWVVRFGLIVATLGLFVYGIWRLFPARHSLESTPLLIGVSGAGGLTRPHRSVLQQRQLELLAQDNLWEPAQALARQWFLDHAKTDPPLWDQADAVRPPAGQFRSGWWIRHKLAQQISLVWQFAVSDPARAVRRREFRKLAEAVQALNQAVQTGQLAFAAGESKDG